MAFGDNPNDEALRDGWRAFCDQIKEAGDHVFKDVSGSTDGERTNAFRYLTQNLSQAFDIWLENHDPEHPTLHAFCGPTRKLGADNADCIYLQSWINDTATYRISGTKGTARMFNIAVQGAWTGSLQEPFGDKPVANLLGEQIETGWDGEFEVWISPDPHEGNWIQSTPGTRKIFYRQYFDTWDEEPGRFRIERVGGGEEPPPAIAPAELLESFDAAGRFVVNCTKDWPDTLWTRHDKYDEANVFTRYGARTDAAHEAADSRRGRVIEHLAWDLAPDQALVIEFEADPGAFWQFGACSVFGASLEFRYRQVSLTSGLSPVDADGTTRVVLAHTDPGFANWIDTQDHSRGWLLFRNMLTRETPDLRTRVVDIADLGTAIGPVATPITREQRQADLRRRREGVMRRYPI
ncbi:MAG TPA: hypothetical protein VIY72_12470 [Acidimicrobiales bacterium]